MISGQKFVERWIEKTDRRRQAFECCEDSNEILALIGKQFRKGASPFVLCAGENHLAHGVNPIAFKKHVLGAT